MFGLPLRRFKDDVPIIQYLNLFCQEKSVEYTKKGVKK